MKLTNKLRHLL